MLARGAPRASAAWQWPRWSTPLESAVEQLFTESQPRHQCSSVFQRQALHAPSCAVAHPSDVRRVFGDHILLDSAFNLWTPLQYGCTQAFGSDHPRRCVAWGGLTVHKETIAPESTSSTPPIEDSKCLASGSTGRSFGVLAEELLGLALEDHRAHCSGISQRAAQRSLETCASAERLMQYLNATASTASVRQPPVSSLGLRVLSDRTLSQVVPRPGTDSQLGARAGQMQLDSVKRKRRAKMKKHKWKKRLKLLRRQTKASRGAKK